MEFRIWQHTPRVNNQIPDINDATLDHDLLSVRFLSFFLFFFSDIPCFLSYTSLQSSFDAA